MADGGECGWRGWRVSRQWWSSLWWPLCTHLPQPQPQSASQPVVLQPCVLCVFVFLFPVPLVAASLYIFLSAHLLRTINENAHINISYFNTKTTHKMTTSRASHGSILLCRAHLSPAHLLRQSHFTFQFGIFPPIKLTYAHSASHSFPTFPYSLLLPSFFMAGVCMCVCLHKFCNISGLCLQLANALKTQIYIFFLFCSVRFMLLNYLVLSPCLLVPLSHPLQSVRIIEFVFVECDKGSLLFQMSPSWECV